MSPTPDLALTAEMLLFEVACLCSRHGIAIPATGNPSAARYHAEGMLQALGIIEPPPAITAAPVAELPQREPADVTAWDNDPNRPTILPPRSIPTPTRSPLARFATGSAAVPGPSGQHRPLRIAPLPMGDDRHA